MPVSKRNGPPGPGSREKSPQVLLCGTGLRLAHITLEALQALKQCRVIFHAFLDKKTETHMRGFCPDVRDLRKLPRAGGSSAADAVLAAAAPGGTVAVLYYGHPLAFQDDDLVSRCRAAKVPYRVLAGLSSLDAVLAAVAVPFLQTNGLRICRADVVGPGDPLPPASPVLILSLDSLLEKPKAGAADFVKYLNTVYPPEHRVKLIRCPHLADAAALCRETELRSLAGVLGKLRGAALLNTSVFIPPLTAAAQSEGPRK